MYEFFSTVYFILFIAAPIILFWGFVIYKCIFDRSDKTKNSSSETTLNENQTHCSIESLYKTSPYALNESQKERLKNLLDKHPEFPDQRYYKSEFIDGDWRCVFKENVSDDMKKELKKILPKDLYNVLNYKSKK